MLALCPLFLMVPLGLATCQSSGFEELFRLPIGEGDRAVFLAAGSHGTPISGGPIALRVAPTGNILIASLVSEDVKVFSPDGRFLHRTEIPLENIKDFVVTSSGGFWVVFGGAYDRAARFLPDGTLAKEVGLYGPTLTYCSCPMGMTATPDEGLWLVSTSTVNRSFLLDAQGKLVQTLEGRRMLMPNGQRMGWRTSDAQKSDSRNGTLDFYSDKGALVRSVALEPVPQGKGLEHDFSLATIFSGTGRIKMDSEGALYQMVSQPARYPTSLGWTLEIRLEMIATCYGPDGKPLGQVALPGQPVPNPYIYDVSPDGWLYFLAWDSGEVTVMRYRFPSSEGLSFARLVPTRTFDGAKHVPLDALAKTERWSTRWDGSSKTAHVSQAKAGGAGTRMISGRMWVSTALAKKFQASVRLTRSGRLAMICCR